MLGQAAQTACFCLSILSASSYPLRAFMHQYWQRADVSTNAALPSRNTEKEF